MIFNSWFLPKVSKFKYSWICVLKRFGLSLFLSYIILSCYYSRQSRVWSWIIWHYNKRCACKSMLLSSWSLVRRRFKSISLLSIVILHPSIQIIYRPVLTVTCRFSICLDLFIHAIIIYHNIEYYHTIISLLKILRKNICIMHVCIFFNSVIISLLNKMDKQNISHCPNLNFFFIIICVTCKALIQTELI